MAKDVGETAIYIAYEENEAADFSRPEKNLLRAILLGAMHDLRKCGEPAKKAQEYFLSHEDDYVFSFRSVCSYLELDEKRVLQVAGLLDAPCRRGEVEESAKGPASD
jgi:hypothetical protein